MKIMVVSDTHGSIVEVLDVIQKESFDLIVHLGDFEGDAIEISKKTETPCLWTKGNMDGGIRNDEKVLDTECGKVLLTHGHVYHVKDTLYVLQCEGEEKNYAGVFFGHTHKAALEEVGDLTLLNPGSISSPRDGLNGSYAVVYTTKKGMECTIRRYRPEKKRQTQGGHLRRLMNYSDRF